MATRQALEAPRGGLDSHAARKEDTRERLLAAGARAFTERGYVAVSVEEIAAAAGMSRMTLYRHFAGKAEIAVALFRANSLKHLPMIAAVGQRAYCDPATVREWIGEIFAVDREQRAILQAFIQANVTEPGFAQEGHAFIDRVIAALGATIPAFALCGSSSRRRVEAWLLLYELLDQSNHAARNSGVAADPLTIEVLADRFIAFVMK